MTAERAEQLRRSIAMLPPGAPALKREAALDLYELVIALLRAKQQQHDDRPPPR